MSPKEKKMTEDSVKLIARKVAQEEIDRHPIITVLVQGFNKIEKRMDQFGAGIILIIIIEIIKSFFIH